jgi:hypothetical protein
LQSGAAEGKDSMSLEATSASRRKWVALGALALVATAFLAYRSFTRVSTSDRSATRSGSTAGGAHAPELTVVPDSDREQLPGAHCWQGLLDADRTATIEGLRAVLGRALASGDELLATYVQERLTELVGNNVALATQLLQWADGATGKELEIVYGALSHSAAVHDPAIAQRLLRTGEAPKGDPEQRVAALTALETQHRLSTDDIGRLKTIALDPQADGPAWTATRTIGRVMKEDFERTGNYAPYWDQLMAISKTSADPAIKVLALEMPAYADPVLDRRYIDDLANVLATAPEREVREMAAFQLGLTEDPDRVLGVFRAAFPREKEQCVRWAIIRFSVRAAGARALPTLDELARIDARFRGDVDEFKQIYSTGVQDFERVWLGKSEHHACTDDPTQHGGA